MTAPQSDDKDERATTLDALLDSLLGEQAGYEMAGGAESRRIDAEIIRLRREIHALMKAPRPECVASSPIPDGYAEWKLLGIERRLRDRRAAVSTRVALSDEEQIREKLWDLYRLLPIDL